VYKKELISIIDRLPEAKVLVVGDLIVDEYLEGEIERISPEAPVPIITLNNGKEDLRLGGAANVFNNLFSLGGRNIYLCGVINKNDRGGNFLRKYLLEKNLDTEGLIQDTRPTTIKTRVLSKGQQIIRLDSELTESISEEVEKNIYRYIKSRIKDINSVIIADYEKGVLTPNLIQKIISLCKENNILSAVDPKFKNFRFYKNVDIVTPNKKEATSFTHIELKDQEDILTAAQEIKETLISDRVLIKLSERGMLLYNGPDDYYYADTKAKSVFDVTGAGDTVIATLIMSRITGSSWEQAVDLSNYAAGIVVHEKGTVAVNPHLLREFIHQ
jgi:D-glycero-beta-D-manno-heptose-7-phosphate kinase